MIANPRNGVLQTTIDMPGQTSGTASVSSPLGFRGRKLNGPCTPRFNRRLDLRATPLDASIDSIGIRPDIAAGQDSVPQCQGPGESVVSTPKWHVADRSAQHEFRVLVSTGGGAVEATAAPNASHAVLSPRSLATSGISAPVNVPFCRDTRLRGITLERSWLKFRLARWCSNKKASVSSFQPSVPAADTQGTEDTRTSLSGFCCDCVSSSRAVRELNFNRELAFVSSDSGAEAAEDVIT